jgi:hypothetical protein
MGQKHALNIRYVNPPAMVHGHSAYKPYSNGINDHGKPVFVQWRRNHGVATGTLCRQTEKPIFVNLRDKEDLDGFHLTSSSEPVGEGPSNRSRERESG